MTGEYEPLLADIDAMVQLNPGNHTLWEQAAAAIRKLTAEVNILRREHQEMLIYCKNAGEKR